MIDLERAFAKIEGMSAETEKAKQSKLINPPKLAADEYLVFNPDGPIGERFKIERKAAGPRRNSASTLTGLVQQVVYYHENGDAGADRKIVLFVCDKGVTVSLDEKARRETVSMGFRFSEQMQALADESLEECTQQELVWALRSKFAGDVTPATFLPAIRQIKFSQSAEGSGTVQHGRESMGKQVNAAVYSGDSAAAIDEEVTVASEVFEAINEVDTRFDILCAVKIDVGDQTLSVVPMPGMLAEAKQGAVAKIAAWLRLNVPTGVTVIENGDIAPS